MVETNVEIINELKKFLEETVEIKSVMNRYTHSPKDFTRNRILTFKVLVLLLLNAMKRSLSVEIQDFFGSLLDGSLCTKQAFSSQRVKLKPLFFHDWNQVLVRSFYSHYQEKAATWEGMKIWALDGSSVSVPNTEEQLEAFGYPSNQRGDCLPIARISIIHDILNNLVITGMLHSYFVAEETVAFDCLEPQITDHVLMLFDRGYPSWWLMYLLQRKQGIHFVMRCQKNTNKSVKAFSESSLMDTTLEIYPPYSSVKKLEEKGITVSKHTPLKVRMVKVILESGVTEILITDLYDPFRFPTGSFKAIYNMRWGVETCYGYLKNELQLGQFSGIRPICIEQDFAAVLFLYNLQSLIEKQSQPYLDAVSRKRKYRYKVNKNISWASLKMRVVQLFLASDSRSMLIELQKLFERYLEPVRPNRKYLRIKKRSPNGKYHTLTNYKRAL
jgi:hypothetical protein